MLSKLESKGFSYGAVIKTNMTKTCPSITIMLPEDILDISKYLISKGCHKIHQNIYNPVVLYFKLLTTVLQQQLYAQLFDTKHNFDV